MICGKCNTENSDVAVYCKKCGYRLDGKKKCPSCGSYTAEGKFCNFCGKQLPDTVRCKYCGSVIYDSFVKNGYDVELGSDVTLGSAEGEEDATDYDSGVRAFPRMFAEGDSSVKKVLSTVLALTGILAVILILVFTFFTGMSCTVTASGTKISESSEYSYILFHFFGKAYSTINASSLTDAAYSAARTLAIFGTIVSVCMILAILGMTVLSVMKISRSLVDGTPCSVSKYVVTTFFLYVAFCLMLLCLVTRYTEESGVVTKVAMNGTTYAGIICGAALSGICVVGRCVQRGKEVYARSGLVGFVLSVVALGILIATVAVLSGRTTLIDAYPSTYRVGYIADYIYADGAGEPGLSYAIVAQFFTFVFLAFACLACSEIITKLAEGGEKSARPLPYLTAALVAAIVVIVFGILEISENVFYWDSYVEGTFVPLIVGVSLYVPGFVLGFVSLYLSKKHEGSRGKDEDISDSLFTGEGETEDFV